MKWTRRLPTKPGLYWWLDDYGVFPDLVRLLCPDKSIGLIRDTGQYVRFMGGRWFKAEHPPIPKPKRKRKAVTG